MKYAVLVNDRLVATCDDLEQAKRAAAACLLRRPAAHPIQKYEEAASETPAVRIERLTEAAASGRIVTAIRTPLGR